MRKNGDDRLGVAEHAPQRLEATLDLLRGLVDRHLVEGEGVALAVVRDRVAFVVDAPHDRRIAAHHAPDHEEGRLHAFGRERVEDAIGVRRQRTVVESQHDLAVPERQRFPVLKAAEPSMLARIDDDGAADPERARRALGGACRPDADQGRQQGVGGEGASHAPVSTPDCWTEPGNTPRTMVRPLTLPKH